MAKYPDNPMIALVLTSMDKDYMNLLFANGKAYLVGVYMKLALGGFQVASMTEFAVRLREQAIHGATESKTVNWAVWMLYIASSIYALVCVILLVIVVQTLYGSLHNTTHQDV